LYYQALKYKVAKQAGNIAELVQQIQASLPSATCRAHLLFFSCAAHHLLAGAGVNDSHNQLLCWLLAARVQQALFLCCVARPGPACTVGEGCCDVGEVEEGVDGARVAVIVC
jgi:hypothetical protein